LCNSISVTAE